MPRDVPSVEEEWLTPTELARELKVRPQTLANMRCAGRGPKFTKLGGARSARVRYSRRDVNEWMATRKAAA